MVQQTFSVTGRRPRVVFSRIDGDLKVQSWEKKEIAIETDEPVSELKQENDILTVADYKSNVTVWVPALRDTFFFIAATVVVEDLRGNAQISGAGDVTMQRVEGMVVLDHIYGNVELEDISKTIQLAVAGGNLHVVNATDLRAQKIGGNAWIRNCEQVKLERVNGNLEAGQTEEYLRCDHIGGNGWVYDSPEAEISVGDVGGNLTVENASTMLSSSVGGNLTIVASFSLDYRTRLRAGGNASVVLPGQPNVKIYAQVGGNIRGSIVPGPIVAGHPLTLVLGKGQALLDLMVGGNLTLENATYRGI